MGQVKKDVDRLDEMDDICQIFLPELEQELLNNGTVKSLRERNLFRE